MEDSYLVHYGIKGMKWGVRRYQNEDGSLTKAGERRYARQMNKQIKQERKYIKNHLYEYSDAELSSYNNRINTEVNYRNAYSRRYPNKGAKIAAATLTAIGKNPIQSGVSSYVQDRTKEAIGKLDEGVYLSVPSGEKQILAPRRK